MSPIVLPAIVAVVVIVLGVPIALRFNRRAAVQRAATDGPHWTRARILFVGGCLAILVVIAVLVIVHNLSA